VAPAIRALSLGHRVDASHDLSGELDRFFAGLLDREIAVARERLSTHLAVDE
jgi:hypothetical protein